MEIIVPNPEAQKYQLLRHLGLQQDRSKHTYKCFIYLNCAAPFFFVFNWHILLRAILYIQYNSALLSMLYSIMFPFSRSSCQTFLLTPCHLSPTLHSLLFPTSFPILSFTPLPPPHFPLSFSIDTNFLDPDPTQKLGQVSH
jgi:hypothetical protein